MNKSQKSYYFTFIIGFIFMALGIIAFYNGLKYSGDFLKEHLQRKFGITSLI